MQSNKEVYVKVVDASSHLLPDDIQSDVVKTIGAVFDKNKRGILLKGLEDYEIEYLLPEIIGHTPNDQGWNREVERFYSNLAIPVPAAGGVKLNVDIKEERTIKGRDGREYKIQVPVSPLDWIKYRFCLVNRLVAKSFDETQNGIAKWYIEDKQAEKERERSTLKSVNKLEAEYQKLAELDGDDNYLNIDNIRHVARILGTNPDHSDVADLIHTIYELKEKNKKDIQNGVPLSETRFMSIVKDPNLKKKAIIAALVEYGILVKQGSYYLDAGNPEYVLGEGLEEVVKWLGNAANDQKVLEYKRNLKEARARAGVLQ